MRKTNVVVHLCIRPTVDGKRQWIEVNPKHDYPQGTIFILRWLPEGATNYKTKTLSACQTRRCFGRLILIDISSSISSIRKLNRRRLVITAARNPRAKLLESEPKQTGGGNPIHSIEGDGLKVGDEWAKALYDPAIPNFLNKYGEKWDAKVRRSCPMRSESMSSSI